MIAELPAAVGTLTVVSQADAIALEQAMRRHVWAWLDTLDVFDRPSLATPRLRRLEQAVQDAEYEGRWEDVQLGWDRWLAVIREATQ